MALSTNTQTNASSISNVAVGQVVTDAGGAVDTVFTCGFQPRYVKWVNRTDSIQLEYFEGMAANSAVRTVAVGTRTLDVSSGITLGSPSLGTGGQFTIKAADIPASKSFSWIAYG